MLKNPSVSRVTLRGLALVAAMIAVPMAIALAAGPANKAKPTPPSKAKAELMGRVAWFLTNNFSLSPWTIARLYKFRWQIELFFKWIKQHLRIKAFYCTTPNAVKTQVWIAISVYVLVAILKKELDLQTSMHEILQVLGVMLFEKTPLKSLFYTDLNNFPKSYTCKQLYLFNL